MYLLCFDFQTASKHFSWVPPLFLLQKKIENIHSHLTFAKTVTILLISSISHLFFLRLRVHLFIFAIPFCKIGGPTHNIQQWTDQYHLSNSIVMLTESSEAWKPSTKKQFSLALVYLLPVCLLLARQLSTQHRQWVCIFISIAVYVTL